MNRDCSFGKYEYRIYKDKREIQRLYGDTNEVVYKYLRGIGGKCVHSIQLHRKSPGIPRNDCRVSIFEDKKDNELLSFIVKRYTYENS